MDFGQTDWLALAVAIVAIWYTILESRRNNSVVVGVRECKAFASQHIRENNQKMFHVLQLVLQNRGLSLHNLRVHLYFLRSADFGSYQVELRPKDGETYNGEFAKGMIAEFVLKSYEQEQAINPWIAELIDPVKQQAEIRIYSQGYLAFTFRVGSLYQRIVSRWNNIASRVRYKFSRSVPREGDVPVNYEPVTLPRVAGSLLFPVTWFAESIRRDMSKQADSD